MPEQRQESASNTKWVGMKWEGLGGKRQEESCKGQALLRWQDFASGESSYGGP